MKKSFKAYVIVVSSGLISLASSILTNLLSPLFEKQQLFFALLFALAVAGIVLLWLKWRQNLEVDIDVDPIRDETAERQHAQRGLIVFLSLYRRLAGKAKSLTDEQVYHAAMNLDYKTLDLENTANTTLGHQIKAIKSHLSKLEHCWIVCTRATGAGKAQSLNYAPVFVEYIKREVAPHLQMHHGADYSVELDDDAIVCRDTYRLIKKIYKEAKQFGLKKQELITDITGGFRAITIGAVLACLDKDVDIQYVGTIYNAEGNPTDEAFPMIVQYQPELAESD
jgi:hypothetical protein